MPESSSDSHFTLTHFYTFAYAWVFLLDSVSVTPFLMYHQNEWTYTWLFLSFVFFPSIESLIESPLIKSICQTSAYMLPTQYRLSDVNSHCSLDQLPLQLSFPPGVEEAAPHSQSGAGLWRVELNDGQRQRGQGCRAVKGERGDKLLS